MNKACRLVKAQFVEAPIRMTSTDEPMVMFPSS
jgi:hypothetical protein